MDEHITTILDLAVSRMEAEESIETILADYPSQRDELALLLYAAQELSPLRSVPPPPEPEAGLADFIETARILRPESKTLCRYRRRLVKRLAALRELWWYPRTRLVTGAMLTLTLLCVLMGVTSALAAGSLPGDWLYPIKLASEEIRLSLPHDQAARAEYHLVRAQTRAQEIQRLAQTGRPIHETTLRRLNRSLEASLVAAASADPNEALHLLIAIEETSAEQASLVAAVATTATTARSRQLLDQACLNLAQARSLASAGRADLYAFRLSASLGLLQIGQPSPTSLETGSPAATVTPTPTSGAQTATPTATATASLTPSAIVQPADTATPTEPPGPSPTSQPIYTSPPSPTAGPSHSPQPPGHTNTPQPPGQTRTPQPPGQAKTPQPPAPTSTPQAPAPTSTPQPPAPTSTPQAPAPTSTPHQPPGQTNTPQPPGQTHTPQPPGQTKEPKPTKKP